MKVIVLLSLLAVCCYAQLSSTDRDLIVSLHNTARASATPVPSTPLAPVQWDDTIAADAQAWVNQCKQRYSDKFSATLYGENPIYMTPRLDVTTAFNYWMQQKSQYSFTGTGSCLGPNCRNFLQIVAQGSTKIGCGVATCSFGIFFVCNYKAYEYPGRLPYTPAAPSTSTTGSATTAAATTASATTATTASATTSTTKSATTASATTATTKSATTASATTATTKSATTASATTATTKTATTGTTGSSGYASIDYRGTKAVLGVHDQKQCGSCWAFSTVTIIEGALGKRGLTVPLLSDQNVLDCSGGGSCSGGWPVTALKGMISNTNLKGGINSNAEYPYTQAQGTCRYNAATSQGAITKYGQTKGDFASMYNALVTYGPVGIAVNADDAWHSYRSGVISKDFTDVNHAVTVVGYDSTLDAWIVKNSWGPSWGIDGYLYIDAKHPSGAEKSGAFWAQ